MDWRTCTVTNIALLFIDVHSLLVPPPPVIEFTEPVYNASEKGDVLVGISVTDGEVTEPVTVRWVKECAWVVNRIYYFIIFFR